MVATGAWNVPSPFPARMNVDVVHDGELLQPVSSRSSFPSPLKSPATAPYTAHKVAATFGVVRNVPSPFPRKTISSPAWVEPDALTTTSILPSPLKSPNDKPAPGYCGTKPRLYSTAGNK